MGRPMRPAPDDPLDAAWAALLERWDQEEKHKAFVGLAATLGQLPDAARRYRSLADDPQRAARAAQGVDRVLTAAMSALTPAPREPAARVHLGVPLAVLAAVLTATMLAARATGVAALTSPVVIVGEVLVVALLPWRRWAARED